MTSFEIIFKIFVPIGLMLIMFGMGLTLKLADFQKLLSNPRTALIGVTGQLILLPLLGFMLAWTLPVEPAIAIGIIILAACPGGVSSNALVFIARGDTALSVTLTAFNSIVAVFTIPLVAGLGLQMFGTNSDPLALDPVETILKLGTLCILPIAIGILVGNFAPVFAEKSAPCFRRFSSILMIVLLTAVIVSQHQFLLDNLAQTWLIVMLLNLGCMLYAYGLCRLASVGDKQTATLVIEIGMQNSNLAILVAITLLNQPALAVAPTVYGVLSFLIIGAYVIQKTRQFNKATA